MALRLPHSYFIKIIFTWVILTCCVGCKSYDELKIKQTSPPSSNISIKELRSLADNKVITIEQELIIGGYVTSCDKAGNFYRTFTIEDLTGGVEIMAGLYDLHNIFPLGYYVSVNLKGCTIAHYNGILQIGRKAKSYSSYPTDYFTSRVLLDMHITCYDTFRPVTPAPTSIKRLTAEMCGRLVRIDKLQLCSAIYPDAWQINLEGKWLGYNVFCNKAGNIIVVHTSEYANYADQYISTEQVTITGILQRGKFNGEECYFIKMRDEKDCSILH